MRRSAFEIIYPKIFKWNTLADLREKYSKLRFPVCAHGSGDAPQEHDQAESDQIEAKKEDDDFVWNVITYRCEKAKNGEIPFKRGVSHSPKSRDPKKIMPQRIENKQGRFFSQRSLPCLVAAMLIASFKTITAKNPDCVSSRDFYFVSLSIVGVKS